MFKCNKWQQVARNMIGGVLGGKVPQWRVGWGLVLSLALAVGMAGGSLGCRTTEMAGLTRADEGAIRRASEVWVKALAGRNFEMLAGLYAQDAVMMPPNGAAVQGRSSIQAWFAGFPDVADLRAEPLTLEGRDDLAYVRGAYSMKLKLPEGKEPVMEQGKYVEIWRRQADGSWKIALDTYSSDLPLPGPDGQTPP